MGEAIDDLKVTTCGENGLEGAILAAFQQFPEVPEEMECPAYDDYIWTLVASDHFALCLLEPEHLRIGVECIRRYMEESPVPALYLMDDEVLQYLNNTGEQKFSFWNFFGIGKSALASKAATEQKWPWWSSFFGKTALASKAATEQKKLIWPWWFWGKTAPASQMTGTEDITMTADQEQALEDLEVAMCGEAGLGGAFMAAFQPEVVQGLPEHVDCPAYDAYIWSFVAEDPLSMCLMDPAHLRVGVEC